MRGHEEASGTSYIPSHLFDLWKQKDPIENYEQFLLQQNVLTNNDIENIKKEFEEKIEQELNKASNTVPVVIDEENELNDVYKEKLESAVAIIYDEHSIVNSNNKELRFIDAIQQGLYQSLEQHPELLLMGQDIAEYGGAFKVTEGFIEKFGKERIRNTPLCESAVIGAALGLSLEGYKSVVEMQFADFVSMGFNQIVNNLAKIHYRWGAKCRCSDTYAYRCRCRCWSISFAK